MKLLFYKIILITYLFSPVYSTIACDIIKELEKLQSKDDNIEDLTCNKLNITCSGESPTFLRINNKNLSNPFLEISQLTALETLDLKNNNISFLHDYKNLTNLKDLNLSSNNLKSFNELEYSKDSLTKLDISYNPATDVTVLDKLTKLTDLNLESTDLSDLPDLSGMSVLEHLNLSNNKLKAVTSADIGNFASLKTLYLAGNPIPCGTGNASINPFYIGTALTAHDKTLVTANCNLTTTCDDDEKLIKTFAGPICYPTPCIFANAELPNTYLETVACSSTGEDTIADAQKACCDCGKDCIGIFHDSDGKYYPGKDKIKLDEDGEKSTLLRIFPNPGYEIM